MIDSNYFINKNFIDQELEFGKTYRMLDMYCGEDLFYQSDEIINPKVKANYTIWILWLQGMENAPRLVQKCYESVIHNKPENYDVILLNESNISEYIKIPECVLQKYKDGIISSTHLSDIIRAGLLYNYGGCWIDSTVYCMEPIPEFMLSGELFVFKIPGVMTEPILKASSWWIYACKGNRLLHAVWKILIKYWDTENELVDYFLFHIIFSKCIDMDDKCKKMYENTIYFNSGNAHVLQGKLGKAYSSDQWNIIRIISPVQKLSYKTKYIQGDIDTNYMHILM